MARLTAAERRKLQAETEAYLASQRLATASYIVPKSALTVATFDAAFRKCDDGYNLVSLALVRKELASYSRNEVDRMIQQLRKEHRYYLSQAEGRLTQDELTAGIEDHGQLMLYVSTWERV